MEYSSEEKAIIDVAAAALLSDGSKLSFEKKPTSDMQSVLSFYAQLGAKVSVTANRISVRRGRYSENCYMTVGKCGNFTLNFMAGLASVSSGTTVFNCGIDSFYELGQNEIQLMKAFGCFISKTDSGFVVASGYTEEKLCFPPDTNEAFVCGLFIGSVLGGMDQLICYKAGSLSFECREILATVLCKYGVTVYYTGDGAYISLKKT